MTTVLRISKCVDSVITGVDDDDNDDAQTCMAKAFRATETGPFSASQAAISVKKANNETVFIKTFHWTNAYTSQKNTKKNSNHSRNFDFPLRQLNTLTLLVCGQLHGGVDVGGHLAGAEAAVLLAAVVGVVALWLQSTWANTGSVNKGGWNLSAGSVLQRCADASAGLMTGLFFVLFFIIWTSLLTELLYGFISIWRQPSFARLIESVAVDELWRNKSIESNHTFVSICSCEQRWVCRGEQLPRCFITLFRQGQQRSIFQKPLSLDVACHREGPARPTHALQDTNTQ